MIRLRPGLVCIVKIPITWYLPSTESIRLTPGTRVIVISHGGTSVPASMIREPDWLRHFGRNKIPAYWVVMLVHGTGLFGALWESVQGPDRFGSVFTACESSWHE